MLWGSPSPSHKTLRSDHPIRKHNQATKYEVLVLLQQSIVAAVVVHVVIPPLTHRHSLIPYYSTNNNSPWSHDRLQ